MSESGPGGPPSLPPGGRPPGGKRPAVGLQLKLPCATPDEVGAKYGADLKQSKFFIRTKQPRPVDTLVRLDALLSSGQLCFRAAARVVRVREPPQPGAPVLPRAGDPGMELKLLAIDDAGRDLILALGGVPPQPLKTEPAKGAVQKPSPPVIAPSPPVAKQEKPATPAPRVAAAGDGPARTEEKPAKVEKPEQPPSVPPPAKKPSVIGIDLGTTNACAAVVKDGKPMVIPSREGYPTIPSIVAYNEKGKFIVGHPAKSQLLINPRNTVVGAKRLVGRPFSSPAVTEIAGRFAYDIIEGDNGEAAVRLGDQVLSLQRISAMVLGEVREIAQHWLGTEVTRAIITVPAYYNDNQRQAVREAGALAGITVERILNEPTAAALAFGHGRTLEQRVLVYDLGGGTFDASVLELHANVYEVVSTGGNTFLGGVDFDKVIVDHLLSVFKEKNGIDFPGDRVALQRITDAAERAKIALSEQMETRINVPFVALVGEKPYDLDATLTRTELVLLTGHLVDRTLAVCKEVLEAKGLGPKDLQDVLLVGGQSRMPLVRERIRAFFDREPSKAVHPDEAVALGAAILADSLGSGNIGGVVLIDVLPMSVGIGLPGGRFKKVVERNTPLPHRRGYTIATTRDNQDTLEIAVFQGDSDKAQENEYLGTLTVKDLPKGLRGSVQFEVMFALSGEALLTVTAEEQGTARTATTTFTTRATPEEIKKRLEEDGQPPPPQAPAAAPPAQPPAQASGVLGWLKRLFGAGKGPEPRA
ncbi:MAG TPA: Hsp70 family protein [Myxococcales bacterium]|nr:Hsp70 family protein [Myxococcales bacterium]